MAFKNLFLSDLQLLAEENQVRLELQMTLDSKDSDLERLRSQLSTLSVHSLDTTSISSGNDLDVGEGYPGTQKALPVITHVHFYFLCTPSVVLAVSFVLALSLYLPD